MPFRRSLVLQGVRQEAQRRLACVKPRRAQQEVRLLGTR